MPGCTEPRLQGRTHRERTRVSIAGAEAMQSRTIIDTHSHGRHDVVPWPGWYLPMGHTVHCEFCCVSAKRPTVHLNTRYKQKKKCNESAGRASAAEVQRSKSAAAMADQPKRTTRRDRESRAKRTPGRAPGGREREKILAFAVV